MKFFYLLLILLAATPATAQKGDEDKIKKLLAVQANAWNSGNLKAFMQTYWKSDSLMFVGKNGVTKGWQPTLENYKKNYPDTAAMGKLSFNLLKLNKLSASYCFVVGKWMLARSIGDISGHFTLLLQKRKGQWVIIADHSS